MNEHHLWVGSVEADETCPPARTNERPLRICVVFDDGGSARRAEALIRDVAWGYECDQQSFSFDELDPPAPGVAAARSASNSDIFVVAVRDERMLPRHIKSWLKLCLGLRDEDQDGALVVLMAEGAGKAKPGASLLDYLESVANAGRLAFFPGHRGLAERVRPTRKRWEMEDTLCGLSA